MGYGIVVCSMVLCSTCLNHGNWLLKAEREGDVEKRAGMNS